MRSLTRRSDFEHLFATGHRTRNGGVTIVRVAAPDGEGRVAVIAGRRVGPAVRRNRAKRRLRAAIREVGAPTGEHVAVIAGPSVPDVPFDRLVRWVRAGLAEASHVG